MAGGAAPLSSTVVGWSPSLPDSFLGQSASSGVPYGLAPARAHPPLTQPRATTGCPPCSHAVAWWRGGSPTCSGTGWQGGVVGPLWVPGGNHPTTVGESDYRGTGPCG